jgi:hypothetical protein
MLIFENRIEWHLLVEPLLYPNSFQHGGQTRRHRTGLRPGAVQRRTRHRNAGLGVGEETGGRQQEADKKQKAKGRRQKADQTGPRYG